MKLHISGNVNLYYVQMLCMIFFPGERFSGDEEKRDDAPELDLCLTQEENGVRVKVKLSHEGACSECERFGEYKEGITLDRLKKVTIGEAMIKAGGELLGYRPSWGMLIGVRPSKVATEMLRSGMPKTRVKKALASDYFVIPKKAALATEVALNEAKIIGTPDKKDCSIYISVPFCPTRCAYCSFVSYTSPKLLSTIPDYLDSMKEELVKTFELIKKLSLNIKTVYIGGGTPTILNEEQLERLLNTVSENTDVSLLEEYTLEAGRPDTLTDEKFRIAREHGVNRVSVNPQILNDDVLRKIGRSHTTEDFLRGYEMARNSGIPIINTDVIAGLPGDRFSTFSVSFEKLLALCPENITVHTFSVKKACDALRHDSNIYSMRGGDVGKCVDYSQLKTKFAGYIPYYMYRQKNTVGNYENVGFAREGTEGLYNIYMMEEVHSIFAVGAGAVSKFVDYAPANGEARVIERFFNAKYPFEYLSKDKTEEKLAAAEEFYLRRGLV